MTRHWLPIVLGWVALALALGIWGINEAWPGAPWLQRAYLTIQLFWAGQTFPKTDNPQLAWARVIAPLFTVSAATLTVLAVFIDRVERARAQWMSDHTVVCGLGEKGYRIVKSLRARGEQVVVVERDADNDYLPLVRELGARAFAADAVRRESLEQAGVPRAKRLVAVTNDDDLNVEIAHAAAEVRRLTRRGVPRRKGSQGPLRCLTLIGDVDLWRLLRYSSLTQADPSHYLIEYFNFDDRAAEQVVRHWSADGDGRPWGLVKNVIVIGEGPLEERLRLHILADPGHPAILGPEKAVDTSDVDALLAAPSLLSGAATLGPGSLILVAMKTNRKSLHVALTLDREYGGCGVTTVACAHGDAGTTRAVGRGAADLRSLRIHDLMQCLDSPDVVLRDVLDDLGRGIHEKWLAAELAKGKFRLGDNARACHWPDLGDEYRLESLHAAVDIKRKLDSVGVDIVEKPKADAAFAFTEEEVSRLAREEHERWVASKKARGWEPGARDEHNKVHPALVPWEQLEDEDVEKNVDEVTAIPVFLDACGLGCRRRS